MKKVLIVTYYWPPAGGPGVQRWLKFVKYLPDFGIMPVVYVPENPNYPIQDQSLAAEVSDQITVLKRKIFEPYKFASLFSKKETKKISSGLIAEKDEQSFVEKFLLFIRGNFFVPDARKFWVKPSVSFLSEYLSMEPLDTIITTGPPHSLHMIGLELKKNWPVKWIADFRDPWTSIGYQDKLKLTRFSKKKHEKLESKVLEQADHIVVTSNATRKDFAERTTKPVAVITNGYDNNWQKMHPPDKKFTVSHIGSLLSGRNPRHLWETFSELIRENPSFKNQFRLRLVGAVSPSVLDSIETFGLMDYVERMGYVSHEEAVVFQQKSQVLLLLEINSPQTRCIIPGKLFEYMRSHRPILAIGPVNWDVGEILSETKTGSCFIYTEKEAIKQQLKKYFADFQKGNLQSVPVGIEKYSRKSLTKKLAAIINN